MDGRGRVAYADAREETVTGGQTPVLPDIAAERNRFTRIIDTIAANATNE